jgi:hypothetical protein
MAGGRICFPMEGSRCLAFILFKFGGPMEGLVAVSMGNIMQFGVHKSQATTQTCRQITITWDAEIHVREKPDQSY